MLPAAATSSIKTMFKAPASLPQDLLLISDIVSAPDPGSQIWIRPKQTAAPVELDSDSEASSREESEQDSEAEEVEVIRSLLEPTGGNEATREHSVRSPSPSSESSISISDSDLDSEPENDTRKEIVARTTKQQHLKGGLEEDDDEELQSGAASILRTKNEIEEIAVRVPEITEIGTDEVLEKVGEVSSIIDNVVVIKGVPSEYLNRASERALDSESLLVFDDRRVLGYVHETFGPTTQPLYQVKFPDSSSINRTVVTVSREVFHVPARSTFVFANQLKMFRGSDASNVHDEEVNEDELEFSDDEAEAAYKRSRRDQHNSRRSSSVASSNISRSGVSERNILDYSSFYDAAPDVGYEPYGVDDIPGPSRQAPLPYDDPYEESHPVSDRPAPTADRRSLSPHVTSRTDPHGHRGRGRGRTRERGRGRGRGRDREDRNSRSRHNSDFAGQSRYNQDPSLHFGWHYSQNDFSANHHEYTPTSAQPFSSIGGTANNIYNNMSASSTHGYDQSQQPFVQPHINPRFASMFGIDVNSAHPQQNLFQHSYNGFSSQLAYGNNSWGDNSGDFNVNQHYSIPTDQQNSTRNSDEYRP